MNSDIKRKANRTCFVPECKTGYRSNKEKKTLFSVPQDPKIFLMESNDTQKGHLIRALDKYDVVFEKHFKEESIERFYRHIINGEEVLVARGKPKLVEGALP